MFTNVNLQLYIFVFQNVLMDSKRLSQLHKLHKEKSLFGRYISPKIIEPLLIDLQANFKITVIGFSVENRPIHSLEIGRGKTKILIWSQMHGNESTTTKAVFDLLNVFKSDEETFKILLERCTICIIPMLNPDGSHYYTRVNANKVDLNRDAQDLSQPESKVLREYFNAFKPDYCFNLHGQRTIFGTGNTGNSATLSFLSPAEDALRTVTNTRKKAMAVIAAIAENLKKDLPNAIGRYDDGFNSNCVGDTFQMLNAPTVLFEAGHYKEDYQREKTRLFIFKSLYFGLAAIANGVDEANYSNYFDIPENEKNFYDVILRNTKLSLTTDSFIDIAIQFEEILKETAINFVPKVLKIENLNKFYGHKEIDAKGALVLNEKNDLLKVTDEIVFVMLNSEKYLIKP